jgi:hypothetical protein
VTEVQNKSNLAAAILKVMYAVTNIEKNMDVGAGGSSYKGVADKDVKLAIGRAMFEAGLVMVPIAIDASSRTDRWEEKYNTTTKQKQSVFVEVRTRYLLIHAESGESVEIAGYGHGTDSQDKAAGKATTYALKYALLYTFLVPTGKIDDADKTHSDDIDAPPVTAKTETTTTQQAPAAAKRPALGW